MEEHSKIKLLNNNKLIHELIYKACIEIFCTTDSFKF